MKKLNLYLLSALLHMTHLHVTAQDTITLNFNPEYHFMKNQGIGFMKLIDNHSDSIKYDGKTYNITFPDYFMTSDTAIGFNYFTGWENPVIKNSTAFLFGNYTSKLPLVYVDYNHNLDFSDDGQPLKFNPEDSTLTVYLQNSEFPSAFFPIQFLYPKMKPENKQKVESIFSTMGPEAAGNTIVSIDYWLGDKRKNYKITHSRLNGKAIKIGLFDYDCNGLYNDVGKDRILIGNFEENTLSDKLEKGAVVYSDRVQVPIAGTVYEVVEIEATGKYLKLVASQEKYDKPLGIGDNISDLKIELISGEIVSIKDLQKDETFILLDFWGTWCKGCAQQLPNLKKLANDLDNLKIVGINYGDNVLAIKKYLAKHDINWINGIANDEMLKKLRIDGFPNYLLLDQKGTILIMNGTTDEIKAKL